MLSVPPGSYVSGSSCTYMDLVEKSWMNILKSYDTLLKSENATVFSIVQTAEYGKGAPQVSYDGRLRRTWERVV